MNLIGRRAVDVELVMPVLGEEIEEGHLRTWIKSEGDAVTEGEVIAIIGAPKLDMDLECPATGVLKTILIDEDEVAAVGETLAIIATEEEADAFA
jgi:pyruvate/2-oxoglutarate dehydrogenase complex dihydrolipoamide acyltransferase (E2) component